MKPTPQNQAGRPTITVRTMQARLVIVLAVVVLLALTANILMIVELRALANRPLVCPEPRRSLPCEAVPMRLLYEDPACANTLLRAMNVTNVHILPLGSDVPPLDNQTAAHMRTMCRAFADKSLPLPAICRPGRLGSTPAPLNASRS
jgi:hypothetical protein